MPVNNNKSVRKAFSALLIFCFLMRISFSQSYKADVPAPIQKFLWPEGKRMAISLTFDDARLSQIDKGIPILDRYGVKGTVYLTPANPLERMEGWKKAVAKGHEPGNHSM